jgi:hypothetical protein
LTNNNSGTATATTDPLVTLLQALKELISSPDGTEQVNTLLDVAQKLAAPQGVFSADVTNGTMTAHPLCGLMRSIPTTLGRHTTNSNIS